MSAGDLTALLSGWASPERPTMSAPWSAEAVLDDRTYALSIATDGHALCAAVEGGLAGDLSHAQLVRLIGTQPARNAAGAPTYWVPCGAPREIDLSGPVLVNAELLGRLADVQRFLARRVKAALRARLAEASKGLTPKARRADATCRGIEREIERLREGAEPALTCLDVTHVCDPILFSVRPMATPWAPPFAFVGAVMPCRG